MLQFYRFGIQLDVTSYRIPDWEMDMTRKTYAEHREALLRRYPDGAVPGGVTNVIRCSANGYEESSPSVGSIAPTISIFCIAAAAPPTETVAKLPPAPNP